MFGSVLMRLRHAVAFVRSYFQMQVLAQSRPSDQPPVRVVMLNGRLRLDGPTVNYSFGTLHTILAAALQQVGIRERAPRSVLLLGLGAGSLVSLLRRQFHVAAPIVAVESNGEILRLAKAHFGLARWPDLEIVQQDAVAFVATDTRTFDLVVVDLFVDAVVPSACRERPFLLAVRQRLSPRGLLLFNLIAATDVDGADPQVLAEQLRRVFSLVTSMAIRSNVVFAAERAMPGTDSPT